MPSNDQQIIEKARNYFEAGDILNISDISSAGK